MPTLEAAFATIVAELTERYGRSVQTESRPDPFEAIVAVLLDRWLDRRKVIAVLEGLRDAGLLEPGAMAEADDLEMSQSLQAIGVPLSPKVLGPLRRVARWVVERGHGSAEALLDETLATVRLRDELLRIPGVGPSTADAILLFALRRPVFPVDRAAYRILVRHGWIDSSAEYDEARALIEQQGPDDPIVLSDLSGWFDRIGLEFCRPTVARCERCPLRPVLPEGGPCEPDVS